MSRLPGLAFPTPNSGQPQTRQQQRPGANLLQRLFSIKKDKLARQNQAFQEDSFNEAKNAYDNSLKTYEENKAAHDAVEQERYNQAQQQYDSLLGTYNSAKSQYDQQLNDYSNAVNQYNAQSQLQNDLLGIRSDRTNYTLNFSPHGNYYSHNTTGEILREGTPQYQAVGSSTDTIKSTLAPVTASIPGEMQSFTAEAPEFSYQSTPFASDVPSFEYVAPKSPYAANTSKLSNLSALSSQLQAVLPQNARNRNKAASFYQMF